MGGELVAIELAKAASSARQSLKLARQENLRAPIRLRGLARRQTDAFCELARHYLPGLTHQSLSDAWIEVRDQVRDLLLRRDDRCRQLRSRLQQARAQAQQAERELETLHKRLERARLDLSSKTGNYKKTLRLDPGSPNVSTRSRRSTKNS